MKSAATVYFTVFDTAKSYIKKVLFLELLDKDILMNQSTVQFCYVSGNNKCQEMLALSSHLHRLSYQFYLVVIISTSLTPPSLTPSVCILIFCGNHGPCALLVIL